jgi:predicted porin
MNKKLVALAVAGAFALPLAAQAQTANVTLYGRVNMDLEFIKGETPSPTSPGTTQDTWVNRVSSNTSRFGLRGTESLGGGLNAIFQIENGSVATDTGGGALAGRESFVGLQGSWGKVTMGNFLAPQDDLHAIFGNTPTLLSSILATSSLWAQGFLSKADGGFDARLGNNIRYDSPNMQGFTFALQYSTRDSSGTTGPNSGSHTEELRHANVIGGNLIYANGPWKGGLSFERNNKVRCDTCNDLDFTGTLGYDFGPVYIAGVYERTKYELDSLVPDGGDLKRNFWGVSGTIPLGGGKLYLWWGRAEKGTGSAADGSTVGGLVKGDASKADNYEITYSYSLSPRTLLYAGWNRINNDDNAKYTFNINPYPVAPGAKLDGIVFGIAHFF